MTSPNTWRPPASLTIRNIDGALKSKLGIRAAEHGLSMEEEARLILRSAPEPLTWLALQSRATVFTTAISEAEMLCGVRAMPEGRRKVELDQLVLRIFRGDFHRRVFAFDSDAADHYATVVIRRRGMGRPIREFDAPDRGDRAFARCIARNAQGARLRRHRPR